MTGEAAGPPGSCSSSATLVLFESLIFMKSSIRWGLSSSSALLVAFSPPEVAEATRLPGALSHTPSLPQRSRE